MAMLANNFKITFLYSNTKIRISEKSCQTKQRGLFEWKAISRTRICGGKGRKILGDFHFSVSNRVRQDIQFGVKQERELKFFLGCSGLSTVNQELWQLGFCRFRS